jgi:hypothetical protein
VLRGSCFVAVCSCVLVATVVGCGRFVVGVLWLLVFGLGLTMGGVVSVLVVVVFVSISLYLAVSPVLEFWPSGVACLDGVALGVGCLLDRWLPMTKEWLGDV